MIVKFSYPSERVKGLSFHPTRPWLLTGLHTGSIHLWDYRLQNGQVIEKFEGHEGPVRSVQFHPKLPLFASGGDDFTVRIWNYKTKKCTFVLKGHQDFVRCVAFHHEMPWVISSSDDQSARVWNYQSRAMIAILTGHSHYVMQAQFHPKQDLIITCSLDQTLRLWNSAPLVKKYSGKKTNDFTMTGSEVELIQIMEGHNAGVNWCSFHNDQPYIVSAADDKKIKLWKYNPTRCWEFDQFTGHTNNVSSVIFHPKYDVLISNSEDKTTRIWGLIRKVELDCFTNKEMDRFWVVAAHPDNFYFACGSDSALYVFTLFRDRVPCVMIGRSLCYGQRKSLKSFDTSSNIELTIRNLEMLSSINDNLLLDTIESISHNIYEQNQCQILVRLKQARNLDTHSKFMLVFYEAAKGITAQTRDSKFFMARGAVFVGRNKIVRVRDNKVLELYNHESETTSPCFNNPLEYVSDNVHVFVGGKILFTCDGQLIFHDPITRTVGGQVDFVGRIKKVIWPAESQMFFAALGKEQITVFTKSLVKVTSTSEKIHIKSGCWLNSSILLYSTKAQIKYLLLNGDTGVIKSTENIMYIAALTLVGKKCSLVGMDCQGNIVQQEIDVEEVLFKQALYEKDIPTIQAYLRKHQKLGDSLVGYLYQKNYAALAINLVQDKRARFSLAINSNNLEIAFKLAQELKDRYCYYQLAAEALRQGHQGIYEIALQNLKEFDKLAFLYALNGDNEKLHMMQTIARNRKNVDSRYQVATYLDDSEERVQLLQDTGQHALAYLAAIVTNTTTKTEDFNLPPDPALQVNLNASLEYLKQLNPQKLAPPRPVSRNPAYLLMNWPHNFIAEDELLVLAGNNEQLILEQELTKQSDQKDVLISAYTENKHTERPKQDEEEALEGEWGIGDEELIIEEQKSPAQPIIKQGNFDFTRLTQGISAEQLAKLQSSKLPSEQFLAGNYEQAFKTLERLYHLKDRSQLKEVAASIILTQTQMISQIAFLQSDPVFLQNTEHIKLMWTWVRQGYKLTTEGKFQETLTTFQRILKWMPLIQAPDKEQFAQILQLCRNYILAMLLELAKKRYTEQPARVLELACYMSICNLQPAHRTLTLRAAMTQAFKQKNFVTATYLARRLIILQEQAPAGASYFKPEIIQNTKKVLAASEQQGTDANSIQFEENLLYDESAMDRICAESLTLMVFNGELFQGIQDWKTPV